MIERFLTKISKDKISSDRITSISFEANQYKINNPDKEIINGTIGMFFDEDENLLVFEPVGSIYENLKINEISGYGFLYPSKRFSEGVFNLLDLNQKYKDNFCCFPSAGGLNAIHHFVHNFIDEDTSTFALGPYWGPYENILGELGYKINLIPLKPETKFYMDETLLFDIISKTDKKKIIILLNIPCQNPTGYTPALDELENIKNSIIKLKNAGREILIFFDIVYIHYSKLNINTIFKIFSDFPFFFNFSSSKTLSLYGFRAGAICFYSKDKSDKDIFTEKMAFSARASTGSINNLGYKIIEKFADKTQVEKIRVYWNFVIQTLKNRSKKFLRILEDNSFKYFRYDEGFFISFFHDNLKIDELNNLFKKNGIFFVPQIDSIRVAISSIPSFKIDYFEDKIKKILN
ncbi:MAG: pyridoxal phosphate-dependent aminotransferase [Exilispira sp.]